MSWRGGGWAGGWDGGWGGGGWGAPAGRGKGRGGKGGGRGAVAKKKTWTRDVSAAAQRSTLPVSAHQSQILEACRGHRAAVVTGDAGCGKSTQVPQYLMDDAPQDGRAAVVLVTQPRRLAAISVAKRVAAERGEAIGSSVGYHVSGDKKEGDSDRARCVYVTTGVLLQLLTHHKDEVLKTYTHLVIDEAHERDVDMDLVLVILRRVLIDAMRAEQRGERVCVPRMVVMSATVDATRMCRFFQGAPHVRVGTRPHKVSVYDVDSLQQRHSLWGIAALNLWRERPQLAESKNARLEPAAMKCCVDVLSQLARDPTYGAKLICDDTDAVNNDEGRSDVLVFVPGVAEIDELLGLLQQAGLDAEYDVTALHGGLEDSEQGDALGCKGGKRRVVIATNVAESSITVPGVRFVFDFGLEKLPVYDPRTRTQALLTRHCSRASAAQRAGRCGRTTTGACIRLYSTRVFEIMPEFIAPEMVRAPLQNVCLKALLLDDDPAQLLSESLDPPQRSAVSLALETLTTFGAVRPREGAPGLVVTRLGHIVASLDVDANVGRLLVFGGAMGCLGDCATIAAAVSLRDVFLQPFETCQQDGSAAPGARGALSLDAARRELKHFLPKRDHSERAQFSDALAVCSVYDEWDKRRFSSRDAAAVYARSQHASYKRLLELDSLRSRLLQRFARASGISGFAKSADPLKSRPALAVVVKKFALLCAFAPCVAVAEAVAGDASTKTNECSFSIVDAVDAPEWRLAVEVVATDAFKPCGVVSANVVCPKAAEATVLGAAAEEEKATVEPLSLQQLIAGGATQASDAAAMRGAEAAPAKAMQTESAATPLPARGVLLEAPCGDAPPEEEEDDEWNGGEAPAAVAKAPLKTHLIDDGGLGIEGLCGEGLCGDDYVSTNVDDRSEYGGAMDDDRSVYAGGGTNAAVDKEGPKIVLVCKSVKHAVSAARMGGVRGSLALDLPQGGTVELKDPVLGAPVLKFFRASMRATVESSWTSPSAKFFVDPYKSAASRARYLVAPYVSALGASRSRQLAHYATLLGAEPEGAPELLLVATARDVRWLFAEDEGGSFIIGAELYGQKTTDELTIWFCTFVDDAEIELINDLRAAISASAADASCPPGSALAPLVALLDAERRIIVDDAQHLGAALAARRKLPKRRFGAARCEASALLSPLRPLRLELRDPKRGRADDDAAQAPENAEAQQSYSKRSRLDDF